MDLVAETARRLAQITELVSGDLADLEVGAQKLMEEWESQPEFPKSQNPKSFLESQPEGENSPKSQIPQSFLEPSQGSCASEIGNVVLVVH